MQRPIYDEFVSRLVEFAASAKIGDPLDTDTQVGPITTEAQFEKIMDYVSIGTTEGAVCAFGGKVASGANLGAGRFVEPTIFRDVTPEMRIANEEIFGPVLAIIPFENEDDAVRIANNTCYGLASGVWTQSLQRALSIPDKLASGTVWVNTYRAISFMAPFGATSDPG